MIVIIIKDYFRTKRKKGLSILIFLSYSFFHRIAGGCCRFTIRLLSYACIGNTITPLCTYSVTSLETLIIINREKSSGDGSVLNH